MEKKKTNFWMYGFFILSGIMIANFIEFFQNNWDERVITREVIEGIDVLIEYNEQGKYLEADVLGDSLTTGIWYLKNSKITRMKFYDDLDAWFIGSHTPKKKLIEIQNKLCPKSDLSSTYLDKDISDKYEWKKSYIEERARC